MCQDSGFTAPHNFFLSGEIEMAQRWWHFLLRHRCWAHLAHYCESSKERMRTLSHNHRNGHRSSLWPANVLWVCEPDGGIYFKKTITSACAYIEILTINDVRIYNFGLTIPLGNEDVTLIKPGLKCRIKLHLYPRFPMYSKPNQVFPWFKMRWRWFHPYLVHTCMCRPIPYV